VHPTFQAAFNTCAMQRAVVAWAFGLQFLQRSKTPAENKDLAHVAVVADPAPNSLPPGTLQASLANGVRLPRAATAVFFAGWCMVEPRCHCACVRVLATPDGRPLAPGASVG
jgi:hypothetical protein